MIYVAKLALKRAIKDYIYALKTNNKDIIYECEEFFNSEQFDLLTECAQMREMNSDYIKKKKKKKVGIND